MDVGRNSKGKWRVVETKVVKIGKLYKKLKKRGKLLKKAFGSICRMFCVSTAPARRDPVQRYKDDELAFMFCILQAKTSKPGWQTSVLALLKHFKGVRFQMDRDGRVEVSGISDPDKVLRKIGKSSKVELQWIQSGQCSANLFMPVPQPTQKEEKPTVQQHHNNNNININPLRLPSGGGYGLYGYGYQYPPNPHPRRIFC